MDNITHGLSGLLLGDALLYCAHRTGTPVSRTQRHQVLLIGALAANGPDLDLLYTNITAGPLGYLLHHRGHTHTVGAALLLGLFISGSVVGIARLVRRLRARSAPDDDPNKASRQWLPWLTGVAAAQLHLLFDLGNNYGIHPGWPWDNRWLYGDTFFIIEPWWLLLLIGAVVPRFTGVVARSILLALTTLILGLCWMVPERVAPTVALLVTVGGLGWIYGLRNAAHHTRLAAAATAIALLVASFSVGKWAAKQRLLSHLPLTPNANLLEIVATPAPGNPLCWSLLAIERTTSHYQVSMARVSAWPTLQAAQDCPHFSADQTAPIKPLPAPSTKTAAKTALFNSDDGVDFHGHFAAPLLELQQVVRDNCQAKAFLRFARVPFWLSPHDSSAITVLGDLRYDRTAGSDFAELPLHTTDECPLWEPPWLGPRVDLLN